MGQHTEQEHEHECHHDHHAHECHEHEHEHEDCREHGHHEHGHHHSHEHGHAHGGVSCSCGHCHHAHGGEAEDRRLAIARIAASAVLLALGLLLPVSETAKTVLFLLSWLTVGYSVAWEAVKNLLRGHALDDMFLMTAASVGAFCLGEFAEGVAVMLLYQIGEFFQDYAVDQSRDSIAELMDIRPDEARAERNGQAVTVRPEEVETGETILVRPGEKIPLDGVILEGASSLNTVALTGESAPRDVEPGDAVLSGCVNLQGLLRVRVTRPYADSTVSRILEMVEHAADSKSKADQFITRFARVYTPVVVGLAVLAALVPPLFFGGDWREWLRSALTFLVISCPCALVISVPLTFFSAIGGASRRGILIKGAVYLETLARTETAVFDKTGTLTQGSFAVTEVLPAQGSREDLLLMAASAEQFSTHPIAQAIAAACSAPLLPAEDVQEIAGYGVSARIGGHTIAVGNGKWMTRLGVSRQAADRPGTAVYAARDGEYLGCILIADAVKEGAREALDDLRTLGVQKCVMLTGDSEAAARPVKEALGLDACHAGLLPDEKVEQVERLMAAKARDGALVFVGDGINDAPVLARADVGVAMGALGSDAAIEAADVVLMDDDPRNLARAIRIARAAMRIVRQNILFSLAVKLAVMILGVMHLTPLWLAIFADVGVCFLAILNAMRAAGKGLEKRD